MSVIPPHPVAEQTRVARDSATARLAFLPASLAVLSLIGVALIGTILGPQKLLAHCWLWAPADGNRLWPGRERELRWGFRFLAFAGVLLFACMLARRRGIQAALGQFASEMRASAAALWMAVRSELASLSAIGWASLAIVTAIGMAVRVRYLFEPLRYDEAFTYVDYAMRPVRAFLQDYSWPNNHLFHTLLVHASTRLFGPAPWAIRLPALIAGILVIPATALLFRRLFDETVGLIAAGLVAASSILIEYSVNARGYSIQVLLFLCMLGLALHLRRRASLAGWTALVLLASVSFFTIPTTLYPFGIVLGWLVLLAAVAPTGEPLNRILPRIVVAAIATIAVTLLLYSPIVLYHGIKPLTGNQFVAPLSRSEWFHKLPQAATWIWQYANRGLPVVIGAILMLGAIASLFVWRGPRRRDIVLLVIAIAWCPILVAIQRVIPFTRVWIFLEPIYLGLAAAGWVGIARHRLRDDPAATPRWPAMVAVAVVSIVLAAFVLRSHTVTETGEAFPQGEEIARYLNGELRDGDRILSIFPAEAPLRYWGLTLPKMARAIGPDRSARRLLVVVRPADQTPTRVTKEFGVSITEFDAPHKIHEIAGAAVYELNRSGNEGRR